jgi:zinc/manganese transport system permease protein
VSHLLSPVFETGFFESGPVHRALAVGSLVALVSGVVGVFTVIRGQSFAGEAFGDLGTGGGAGAYLVGVGPLWGFVAGNVLAAGAMEMVGIQRARGRDLATGIVLGAGIGLAALFLYLGSTQQGSSGATVTILFGSVFAIASTTVPLILLLSAGALAIVLAIYRPLLLSSLNAEMAAARGIRVRMIGALYLLALALAAALAAITIGTILSTALLIGPAAGALRLTSRPLRAMACAAAIGILTVWAGVVLAYDSYYWPPVGRGWPVSFFVVTLVLIAYLTSGVPDTLARRRAGAARGRSGSTAGTASGRPGSAAGGTRG